jgi:catechol 2,3-dioxygenase-like lactoylglutathione lyase family enzyme
MFRDAFTILDTADVARLSAFYVDQLGFTPGYRWPDQEEPIFRVVSLDAFSIGLSKTDALPASGWRIGRRRTSNHRMGRAHGHDF